MEILLFSFISILQNAQKSNCTEQNILFKVLDTKTTNQSEHIGFHKFGLIFTLQRVYQLNSKNLSLKIDL